MALGTVASIDQNNPQYGTVSIIDTGDIFNYDDPLFKTKGLVVTSPCTFDIDFTQSPPVATNLQPYTATEKVITTPVEGDQTIATGETLIVKNGGVIKGNITTNNGILRVEDSGAVVGNITDTGGSDITVRRGGNVKGNITVQNGSVLKVVNKGVIKGNVVVSHADRLIIGNNNGGGTITGTITTKRVRRMEITATSTINCG